MKGNHSKWVALRTAAVKWTDAARGLDDEAFNRAERRLMDAAVAFAQARRAAKARTK